MIQLPLLTHERMWRIYFNPVPQRKTRCVCETQMPLIVANSIESHAYVKASEK
jgi:hypothetical protein